MGALFELLAQIVTALGVALLSQIASLDAASGAAERPPSVQRTILRAAPAAAAQTAAAERDCTETPHLSAA